MCGPSLTPGNHYLTTFETQSDTVETRFLECNPLRSSGDLQSAVTFGQDALEIFRGAEVS
ncbi:hypothetical protein AVEN_25732-1, partial [Araneus ventricosus]